MPKAKKHKGLLKRVRISKSGLVRHRSASHKHLRSGKGGKKLRQYRKDPFMSSPDAKRLQRLLHRRLRGRSQPVTARRRSPAPTPKPPADGAGGEAR
jgi:large subunit ribosomal protein L35